MIVFNTKGTNALPPPYWGRRKYKGFKTGRGNGRKWKTHSTHSILLPPANEYLLSICHEPGTVVNTTHALFPLTLYHSVNLTLLLVPFHLWSTRVKKELNNLSNKMMGAIVEHRSSGSRVFNQHSMLPTQWHHLFSLKSARWVSLWFSIGGGQEGQLTAGAHWWPGWIWPIYPLTQEYVRWPGWCFSITKLEVVVAQWLSMVPKESGKSSEPPPKAPWPSSRRDPGQVAPQAPGTSTDEMVETTPL